MRERLTWLAAGFAFGILAGVGLARGVLDRAPAAPAAAQEGRIGAGSSPVLDGRSRAGPLSTRSLPGEDPRPDTSEREPASGDLALRQAELDTLRARIEKNPKDVPALVRLGDIFFELGEHEQSLAFYQWALATRSEDPDLLTVAGLSLRELGRFDEALAMFEQAHRADPEHWQSLYDIVVVAGLDLGQGDRARRALADLERRWPDAPHLAVLRDAVADAGSGGGPAPMLPLASPRSRRSLP